MGKGTLTAAWDRSTKGLGDRRADVPRREITFTIDHTVCAPGIFEEDFEITLSALTSADELAAARASKGEVTVMALDMARRSIVAVDGEPLDRSRGQDEWLWQVLGGGGRQLVAAMFAQVGTPGEAALGKALETLRIG